MAQWYAQRMQERKTQPVIRRQAIIDAVRKTPGLGMRELARTTDLCTGTLSHYLRVLRRDGELRAVRFGSRLCIVPYDEVVSWPQVVLRKDARLAEVFGYVVGHPGCHQREVLEAFPLQPRSSTQNRLGRLVGLGLVSVRAFGRRLRYTSGGVA